MKDLRRIQEENPSSAELSLLRSARLDVPPRDGKRRLLATLGVATAGSAAAAATPGATTAWVVSKWIFAGMLAGTLATGSVEAVRSHLEPRRSRPETSSTRETTPGAQGAPSVAREKDVANAPSAFARGAAPADVQRIAESTPARAPLEAARQSATPQSPTRAAPSPSAPPQPTPAPSLAEEIATLDRARQALQGHDPTGALENLDAFEASFPNARLRPEARVLRMEVLLGVGRYDEARAIGRRLLEVDPSSALAQRVRSLLRNAEAREIQNSPFGH